MTSVVDRQERLIAKIAVIEDPHERMAYVVERVRKRPALSDAQKIDVNRVQGCVSRVWLVKSWENGHCQLQLDADSTLVRGLAALVCDLYDGATREEILAHPGGMLESLGLTNQLSPTRRFGLEQVERTIREFAQHAQPSAP